MDHTKIPIETLVHLSNQLALYPARDPRRKKLVQEIGETFGLTERTIYRYLKERDRLKLTHRRDAKKPRIMTEDDARGYAEIVAALRVRTTNKNGRKLPVKVCIRLLEESGVMIDGALIKAPPGLLKVQTIYRYLSNYGYTAAKMSIQPAAVRFQAEHSNECWQFDFSPSDLKKLKNADKHDPRKLMFASVVDDRSGVCYEEYLYVEGEECLAALRFLFNAMAPKKEKNFPFQGIPAIIYTDNGPVAKSALFRRVMASLGVEVKTHMPAGSDGRRKTTRAKGKVERQFRTSKESFETLFHFHEPESLLEANQWLSHYLKPYNDMPHRSEPHSRLEDWVANLPTEGFRKICSWERFTALVREPETRTAGTDARVQVNGLIYQLAPELAGQKVIVYWGLFDSEVFAEYEGKKYGPFCLAEPPIPFGKFHPFKKTKEEERADKIAITAKKIVLPKSALSGQPEDELIKAMIEIPSIPFVDLDPYEEINFVSTHEAKLAISGVLGIPLGRLQEQQLNYIDAILAETLNKKIVIKKIKDLFSLKVCEKQKAVGE